MTGNSSLVQTVNLDKMIAEAAYYKAEKRGFYPGNELRDWLEAKTEIIRLVYGEERVRVGWSRWTYFYIADFERQLSGIISGTKWIVTIGHYEYLSIVAAMHRTKLWIEEIYTPRITNDYQ